MSHMDLKPERPSVEEEASVGHPEAHPNGTRQKRGIFNTLYPPGPKPGAGGRIKNHWKKFWWCELLVFAIITLIIVLPVIYVAIPKKAQHDINASTLEVDAQDITSPQPDGLHLKLVSTARSSSKYHPRIEGFRGAFHLEGQDPFMYIDVPEVKSEAETPITVDQDVTIASMDAFKEYNKVAIGSEEFSVYLTGKTKIHQSGLQAISVDYDKKVTMKGLNKLQGLSISDLKILLTKLPDGSNLVGNVHIPNPSVMTLTLGNITMNLAVDGTPIGTTLIPDMVLRPGDNVLPMRSNTNQSAVLAMVTSTYKNGVLPLEISGNSSMVGDQHLEYFEAAIQSQTVKLDLNVTDALAAIGFKLNTTQS